jgi:sulfur carrier protein
LLIKKTQNGEHHQKGVILVLRFLFCIKGGYAMQCNGKMVVLSEPRALKEFLVEQKYDCKAVAVERNGEIIARAEYDRTYLLDSDCLEIVRFVGGG